MNLVEARETLRDFAAKRDWDHFHSPKNLAMALAAEVGELLEVFQWLSEDESREVSQSAGLRARAEEELADVMIYAIRMADILGIDLEDAVPRKIAKNEQRYPVSQA